MKGFRKLSLLFVVALPFLADPAAPAAATETFRADGILVRDVWARASKVRNSAAYMTITNEGEEAVRLVAVSTPIAKRAELHTTRIEDGVMKMRPVEAIEIGPGQTVRLEPGGHHVMLLGLAGPLRVDDRFDLTLAFADGTEIDVAVPVREAAAMGMKMDMDMGKMKMDMGKMKMGEGMAGGGETGMKGSAD